MESKEVRIKELEKQILEIQNEAPINYMLVEVIPDCGGGIKDRNTDLVISSDEEFLRDYAITNFKYNPIMDKRNPNMDIKSHCETWYKIVYTNIQIH